MSTALSLSLAVLMAAASVTALPAVNVVELFTSEGCSSCPPADAVLAALVEERPEVIAIAWHVPYWDYLGWSDPFAQAFAQRRQELHARRFALRSLYTPQAVVNGTSQMVGSQRAELDQALRSAGEPLRLDGITVSGTADPLTVGGPVVRDAAEVIAILVEDALGAQPTRGENRGVVLRHARVARSMASLIKQADGTWSGKLAVPAASVRAACRVVILASDAQHTLIGAGQVPWE